MVQVCEFHWLGKTNLICCCMDILDGVTKKKKDNNQKRTCVHVLAAVKVYERITTPHLYC